MTNSTATEKVHAPAFGDPHRAFVDPLSRSSISRDATGARFIVVMGVSGTGKSTLGVALARAMCLPFIDGDDLHPAANVAKMSRGEPLDDDDRRPWLETIRRTAVARVLEQDEMAARRPGVIVACSSLKRTYRAVLRGEGMPLQMPAALSPSTYFVYLRGERDVLMARMQSRQGHFMKAVMLESQLDTLESPEDEAGVVSVSVDTSTAEQVERVVEVLGSC